MHPEVRQPGPGTCPKMRDGAVAIDNCAGRDAHRVHVPPGLHPLTLEATSILQNLDLEEP